MQRVARVRQRQLSYLFELNYTLKSKCGRLKLIKMPVFLNIKSDGSVALSVVKYGYLFRQNDSKQNDYTKRKYKRKIEQF